MSKHRTDDLLRIRRRVKLKEVVVTIVVILLVFGVAYTFGASPNINWATIGQYLFSPQIISGVGITIMLTVVSMSMGCVLGVLLALARQSRIPALRWVAGAYIWLFRGVPLLVQILFAFNLALFIPKIGIAGYSVDMNFLITPVVAAVAALTLHEGSYMAEIIRGGLQSVDSGQMEAATAQGLKRRTAMWRIIIPQALPSIIPATGNQAILMMKSTSLVVVIGAADLMTRVERIYTQNLLIIELLLVACIWYLFLVTIGNLAQYVLEERMYRRRVNLTASGNTQTKAVELVSETVGAKING